MNGTDGKLVEVATVMAKEVINTQAVSGRWNFGRGIGAATSPRPRLHISASDSTAAESRVCHKTAHLHCIRSGSESEKKIRARRFSRRATSGRLPEDFGRSEGAESLVRAIQFFKPEDTRDRQGTC